MNPLRFFRSVRSQSSAAKLMLGLFLAVLLQGCLHWRSGLPETPHSMPGVSISEDRATAISELVGRAEAIQSASDLDDSILHHQYFLDRYGSDRVVLDALSNQLILKAAAYTSGRRDKREIFRQSMQVAEASMRLNPAFEKQLLSGVKPWDAVESLDQENMDAMLFWVTGLLYIFKDGMIPGEQIFNSTWIGRARTFLDRMEAIDTEWRGGAVMFSRSIVDAAVPGMLGGDKQRAWETLEKAVQLDGNWMLARWGRAKYFHTKAGNKEAFLADLEVLLSIDPETPGEAVYWRRYFLEDAREMLANQSEWFR